MRTLRKKIVSIKNGSLFVYFVWTVYIFVRSKFSILLVSDIKSIENRYCKVSGGRKPNIVKPRLFSEKMQWIKFNHYDSNMEQCADKHLVLKWMRERGYGHLLNEVYQIVYDVKDLDIRSLPDKFTIKATHGSGWNLIVKDKQSINWLIWKLIFRLWLKSDIFWAGREWVYKELRPGLIVEKYMEDSSGELKDYKFHCFNGKPKFIQVNQGRSSSEHVQNFYDITWQLQEFGKDIPVNPTAIVKPPMNLSKMLDIAQDLAKNFYYVRVDFYEVEGKIVFGELTFFPAGGYPDFKPTSADSLWGDLLCIENIK